MLCRALGAGQDLKEFDVDNAYGLAALKRILEDCVGNTLHMEAVKVIEDLFLLDAVQGRLHALVKILLNLRSMRLISYRHYHPFCGLGYVCVSVL